MGDGLWTRLSDPQFGYNESYYFASDQYGTGWSNTTFQNGVVTGATIANFQPESVNNTTNRIVDTSLIGLNATWKPAERLSFTGDVYRSKAKRPEGGADTFVTAGLVTNSPAAVDTLTIQDLPNSLPNLNVAIPPSQLGFPTCPPGTASLTSPGQCSYTSLTNAGLLNNNNYWSTHYVGLNGYTVHDQVTGLTLDGTYDISAGALDGSASASATRAATRAAGTAATTGPTVRASTAPVQQPRRLSDPVQPVFVRLAGLQRDLRSRARPTSCRVPGVRIPIALPQTQLHGSCSTFLKSLNGKPNPFYCPPTPPCTGPLPLFNFAQHPAAGQSVQLLSTSPSARSPSTARPISPATRWAGNVGLAHRAHRHLRLDRRGRAQLAVDHTRPPDSTRDLQRAVSRPRSRWPPNGQYTLLLPSANFNYWAVPEQLQLRLGLAETMSRPDLNQLAPTSSNNAINGQPQLNLRRHRRACARSRPCRRTCPSESGTTPATPRSPARVRQEAARRHLQRHLDRTSTWVPIAVQRRPAGHRAGHALPVDRDPAPANGSSRDLFYGVELTWQHTLESGFGARLQYTHTWNKSYYQNGNSIGAVKRRSADDLFSGAVL